MKHLDIDLEGIFPMVYNDSYRALHFLIVLKMDNQ